MAQNASRSEAPKSEGRLGESKSERWCKCLRNCVLCLCDEVCIYHRDGEFYDHTIEIGLHILKVRPVESKQPRLHRF